MKLHLWLSIGPLLLSVSSAFPEARSDNRYEAIMRSFGNFGSNFQEIDAMIGGNSLLDHFDINLGLTPFSNNDDMFGMFGRARTPWWKKDNVCVKREVLEEDDAQPSNINIVTSGQTNFHMQVNQCIEGENYYECTNTVAEDGSLKTLKATYTCCHGFRRMGREGCTEINTEPLEETMESIGGKEFLSLLVENKLESFLNNVTLFVPDDDAVEDFRKDLEEMNTFTHAENVVYNIDDGLIFKRKKRSVMIVQDSDLQNTQDILTGHIIPGFIETNTLKNTDLLTSDNADNDKIRMTIYPTRPEKTVMANCARVTSKNNHASNGIIHMVDKVILPAKQSIAEILETDLQFKTFVLALESNGLNEMLAKEGHFTVFAPTDEAFEKLDAITRDRVLGNGGCARDIIQSHILSDIICSGIVQHKVKVSNIMGRDMMMHIDEDGNVLVEGIKLMLKDKMATNGVIHVIEDVIIEDSVMSVIDHLKQKNSHKLLSLLEKSNLTRKFESLSNLTFFAPSEQAISDIPKKVMDELIRDKKRLEEILLHHVTPHKKGSCHLSNNQHLDTVGGKKLRINIHKHFGQMHPTGLVQCARIVDIDKNVCGGKVHTIDKVLTPPSDNVVETLKNDHSEFAKLIDFAGLKDSFSDKISTILAPVNSAFDGLEEKIKTALFTDKQTAESVVRNHVVNDAICCSSIPRRTGFLQMSLRKPSDLGEMMSLRRSNGGHIFVNQASVLRCDVAATNGLVHSVDRLILPSHLLQKKNRRNEIKGWWMF